MEYTKEEIDAVMEGYVDALTWAERVQTGDDNDDLSCDQSGYPWEKQALRLMRSRVEAFMQLVPRADFAAYCAALNAPHFGHDIYLTTHGHGVGFWDRELGDLGDRLTALCGTWESYVTVYRKRLRLEVCG